MLSLTKLSVDEVNHNIIREALRITGTESGIDVVYSADIPLSSAGVGLARQKSIRNKLENNKDCYISQSSIYSKEDMIEN